MRLLPISVFLLFIMQGISSANSNMKNNFADGDAQGNGGDVISCYAPNGNLKSVEVLDVYEGREYYGIKLDFGPPSASYSAKIEWVLNHLDKKDEERGAQLAESWLELKENSLFKSGIVLEDIPDSKHLFFPVGCKVEQIAIQKDPEFPGEKRYIFNKDLWDKLDEKNRAVLILHELLFHEALGLSHLNSRAARFLNANLWTVGFATLSNRDYLSLLEKVRFPFVNSIQSRFKLKSIVEYHPNSSIIKNAVLAGGNTHVWMRACGFLGFETDSAISFYPNGQVAGARVVIPKKMKVNFKEIQVYNPGYTHLFYWQFAENQPNCAIDQLIYPGTIVLQGKEVMIERISYFSGFYRTVLSIYSPEMSLLDYGGNPILIRPGSPFRFDLNDRVYKK